MTVFVGIYNGEKYLKSLLKQIQSQDLTNYELLIIDNASSDNSFEIIQKWKSELRAQKISIKKNDRNLGGQGSWNLNLRHVQTPWITMIHQDDFYKPFHLSKLDNLIKSAGKDVIGVSTTMGSLSHDGKILNSTPRSSWFNKNLDAPNQFIQNLKSQAVPYPSTAFLVSAVEKSKIPIHSPTFSDTEQTLKLLAFGKFKFSNCETMLYRENPESESHVLNLQEKYLGTSIALNRVFNSMEFSLLLDQISIERRSRFAQQVYKALEHRLPRGDLLNQLRITALEAMTLKWGYTEKSITNLMYSEYKGFASPLTLEIITSLGRLKRKIPIDHSEKIYATNHTINALWQKYFKINLHSLSRFHKLFVIVVYRLVFLIKPNHRWRVKK